MSFTGNLNLDKVSQGQVRFDTAISNALDKLDAHFMGSDSSIFGIGHASKTLSFRPLGVERATLGADALRVTGGVKVGAFTGTPETGMIRNNAGTLEGWNGSSWVTLGASGSAVLGTGAADKWTYWSGSGTIAALARPTAQAVLSNGSGQRLLYTCPSSTRALVGMVHWYNPTTACICYYVPNGQSVGATFKMWQSLAWASVSAAHVLSLTFSPGDRLYIDSGGTTITARVPIIEYPTGSILDNLIQLFKTGISTGSKDTLYTVPGGKNAGGFYAELQMGLLPVQYWWVFNGSAGSANIDLYHNDGTTDRQIQQITVAAGAFFPFYEAPFALTMTAGHSLKVQSNQASCAIFGRVKEWTPA